MKLIRSFEKGYMNKSFNNRILPKGEYSDATNVAVSADDQAIGLVEEADGNERLTEISFNGVRASLFAECIGAFTDDAEENIYWFVHDPGGVNAAGATAPALDYILSYNMVELRLIYHVVSSSVLNFNPKYRINAVNKIDDMLLFTDNFNPPRKINVNRNYAFPTGSPLVDVITQDDVNVIVKPPECSPTVVPFDNSSEENFIEDRFISFAYRYRYQDGEYSALSSFSEVAFDASRFDLESGNFDNLGMLNKHNAARVTVKTGPSRVIGFDIVFKLSDSTVINVIERIDKNKSLIADDIDYTIVFDNSKIYTVLPEGEIGRLFDNVPLTAKAQTIMGNRLMYGNYEEGRDLIDVDGNPVKLDYNAELVATEVGTETVDATLSAFTYTIHTPTSKPNATATFAVPVDKLKAGNEISFRIRFSGSSFSGASAPGSNHPVTSISFFYKLPRDFSSVADLVLSPDGISSIIGTSSSGSFPIVSPISSSSCSSSLGTDVFNCSVLNNNPAGYTLLGTGTANVAEPIKIGYSGTNITLTIPAVKRDNGSGNISYEYMQISSANLDISIGDSFRSLHSNRDYDVGIVYLDEYKRSTTVLISRSNTLYIPAENSVTKNTIRVNIPTTQKPPAWATSYRFFVKPSGGAYETIYSNIFYQDPEQKTIFFKLEGNNQTKMADDEVLIVKSDSSGALSSLEKATVIDIESKPRDFLVDSGLASPQFNGLYMSMDPGSFDVSAEIERKTQGVIKKTTESFGGNDTDAQNKAWANVNGTLVTNSSTPYVSYPLFNVNNDPATSAVDVENFSVPKRAIVRIKFDFRRNQKSSNKGSKIYRFDREFTATQDYDNFYDFWVGENIASFLDLGVDTSSNSPTTQEYFPSPAVVATADPNTLEPITFATPTDEKVLSYRGFGSGEAYYATSDIYADVENSADKNLFQFHKVPATMSTNPPSEDVYWLAIRSGAMGYSGKGKQSVAKLSIEIFTSESLMIFETEPKDISDELYYETSQCFDITTDGSGDKFHSGNTQNQTASQSAICDLTVFNCYAFGNGAESFRVRDRTSTKEFQIGERANAVSNQDYKNIRRFDSITYSGIHNADTNLNRLNEFNLSLGNFKDLEKTHGTIEVIDGRMTDVLVLQEDKVSYVLAGKNLLSDSVGGGDVASIPEVLGTQIARMEEYGISKNPESYARYGPARFFTDAKRGSVIQLNGSSYSDEKMLVISEKYMTDFFRDDFSKMGQYTEKLGGYDANIDEYILHSSEDELARDAIISPCDYVYTEGTEQPNSVKNITVNLGEETGSVSVALNIDSVSERKFQGSVKLASANKTTGQTTSAAEGRLIDSNASFSTTVTSGDQIFRAGEILPYNVNSVVSDTELNITVGSNSEFLANEDYTIKSAVNAKTLVDTGDARGRVLHDFTTISATLANHRIRNKNNGKESVISSVTNATTIVLQDAIITEGASYDIVDTTGGNLTPTLTWNGATQGGSGSAVRVNKTFAFTKNAKTPTTADLSISVPSNSLVTYRVSVPCPDNDQVEVRRFVLTTAAQAGLFADFGHGIGTGADIPYNSINTTFVTGGNNIVSHYSVIQGTKGIDPIPDDGESVVMALLEPPGFKPSATNQFNFLPSSVDSAQNGHRLMYLLSATDYNASSSQADLVAMMGAATTLSPSLAAHFSGTVGAFTYNNPSNHILYLIWDLRDVFTISLKYNASTPSAACSAGAGNYFTDSRYLIPGNNPTLPTGAFYDRNRLAKNIWTTADATTGAADGLYIDNSAGSPTTGNILALVQNGVYSDKNIVMAPVVDATQPTFYQC